MKQKTTILLFACIIEINSITKAQKGKITTDDDTVKVDGMPYIIVQKKGVALSCNYKIISLTGKEIGFATFSEYNNPQKANSGNPKGRVTYSEVTFYLASGNLKCEIEGTCSQKKWGKEIYSSNLIKDGEWNEDAVKNYVSVYGTKYSDEKNALNQPKVIIINNGK